MPALRRLGEDVAAGRDEHSTSGVDAARAEHGSRSARSSASDACGVPSETAARPLPRRGGELVAGGPQLARCRISSTRSGASMLERVVEGRRLGRGADHVEHGHRSRGGGGGADGLEAILGLPRRAGRRWRPPRRPPAGRARSRGPGKSTSASTQRRRDVVGQPQDERGAAGIGPVQARVRARVR